MRKYFNSATSKNDAGFPQCMVGNSQTDNEDYVVTTNSLHADEVPEEMLDAKTASELMAGLLNAYYNDIDVSKLPPDKVMAMGRIDPDGHDSPAQANLFTNPPF